ncbi:MAG TPA: VOC family protein [Candidatus Binatus sp.]|nr:VOC family protein [Candidatus Binatus sp.]
MRIGSIVIRCYEFDKMYEFWKEALHYAPKNPPKNGWVILRDPERKGPNISLDQHPDQRTGKRSRFHFDLYTTDQKTEVERLVKLGAAKYPWRYKPDDDFVVLEDPDQNLFCVVQVPAEFAKEEGLA